MGQNQPVQVFLLVTTDTLEENLLATLSAKHQLSLAVLDPDTDTSQVEMSTGMEELKRRMEILLGARPEAAEDESMKAEAEKTAAAIARKEKVAAAGGQLVGSAFAFIGELFADRVEGDGLDQLVGVFKAKLGECVEKNGGWSFEHDHHPSRRSVPGQHGPIPGGYRGFGGKILEPV